MHRANTPSETVTEYYKRTLTIPFLDHLKSEMSTRFTELHARAAIGIQLVPSVMSAIPTCDDLSYFIDDLPSEDTLDHELFMWNALWKKKETCSLPSTIQATLKSCDAVFFPNITVILKICATFPVTSCECERSISALRLLKTYLRSTMGQDRLSSLALAFIHRNVTVDIDAVVQEFARKQPRRILLPDVMFEKE